VPETEYWEDVITAVGAVHPQMLFTAEAYWDLEWQLQQLGFDYCYDKRLYDRLLQDEPADVRGHLEDDLTYQQHLLRFTENHDEPRAAFELGPAALRAAAVTIATLPGATLWHEGQFDGWRIHVPVLLGRRPVEPDDTPLREFHLRLVGLAHRVRRGTWAPCEATGWPDNTTWMQLLSWCWTDAGERTLVVVNHADNRASAMVHVPWTDLAGRAWRLDDPLNGDVFERDGDDLASSGLFVDLPPWGFHVLRWTCS
jgi:hypothetical protein